MRRVLALVTPTVLVWLVTSFAVTSKLTRRAKPVAPEPTPTVPWGAAESLRLRTSDGHELGAWFFAGRAERPVVVLLHGNGESRTACLPQAELLASAGYSVLAVTLRAHGDSTGDRNDFGSSARRDVVAAVGWLDAHRPGAPVVIWGRSLGSAAALFAARDLGTRVRGYVLECPFRDLRTAVRNRLRVYLPPVLDVVAFAGMRVTAPLVLPDFASTSPLEAAAEMPPEPRVLALTGTADRRATPEEARAISDRLGPRAELVVIEGGDHLQLNTPDPDRYRALILSFLEKCSATP
ncbi:MAG: alpha/beta fold hydrolase [Planctomycetes bacterium]|nr:alpha/beta fold hydrolase [Planctomycetota bacterium]